VTLDVLARVTGFHLTVRSLPRLPGMVVQLVQQVASIVQAVLVG
jgi:hypothetical protein